ncbi:MAG: TolC family protein [Deltaproteobacteria bacterium]|nr:TolC family protein [Deltaproteobacteria bacterium]
MLAPLLLVLLSSTSTQSLGLAEAVRLGLAHAPAVEAGSLAIRQAELAQRRAALERVRLRVDAQVAELWARSDLTSSRGEASGGALGLSNLSANLEVPVFSGFRVESAIDRTQALFDASAHELHSIEQGTALAITRAYWAVRRAELLLAVELEAERRLVDAERRAIARSKTGLAPEAERARAEAGRRLQAAVVAERRAQQNEVWTQLSTLLGDPSDQFPSDQVMLLPLPGPLPELIDEALATRPELAAARARALAADHGIKEARSGYYPNLSVSGLVQYGNNPLLAGAGARAVFAAANPFAGLGADVQVGAVVSINLFDTFTTTTQVAQAEAEAARLERLSADRAQRLVTEVEGAYLRLARHHAVAAHLKEAHQSAAESTQLLSRRYRDGDSTLFELLEAELARLEIERRQALNDADGTLAGFELAAARGRLLGDLR